MSNTIKNYIDFIHGDEYVHKWGQTVLVKAMQRGLVKSQDEWEHILDYLVSNQAPPRIMKMSYVCARDKAAEWIKTLTKVGKMDQKPEVEGVDVKTVKKFRDGFRIVQLLSKSAFTREGFLMHNCVATYYGRDTKIYSLRDPKNNPHCTMEHGQQIKGKGNGDIHPKYIKYVIKFLEFTGMEVRDNEMEHLGYINVAPIKKYIKNNLFMKKYIPNTEELLPKKGIRIVRTPEELKKYGVYA